jgi:hypothetical protein
LASGLCAGRLLPLNLPELEVSGLALVTAIDDCPPIAEGEGSVVTARFVTREVHFVASVDVLGADGERLCCDTESFGLGFPSRLPPQASCLF